MLRAFCRLSSYTDSAVTVFELYNYDKVIGKVIKLKHASVLRSGRVYMADLINDKRQKFDEGIVEIISHDRSFTGFGSMVVSVHGGAAVYSEFRRALNHEGYKEITYSDRLKLAFDKGKIDYVQYEAARLLSDASLPSQELFLSLNKEGLLSRFITCASGDGLDGLKNYYKFGRKLSETSKIVIAGKANVGKSSLFNVLVGSKKALVFDGEGTTLDYVDDNIEIGSFPFVIYDTAGIKQVSSGQEIFADDKLWELLDFADLVLYLSDYTVTPEEHSSFLDLIGQKKMIRALNKIDVRDAEGEFDCKISSKEGKNLDLLRSEIISKLELDWTWDRKQPILFTERQFDIVDSPKPAEVKKRELLRGR